MEISPKEWKTKLKSFMDHRLQAEVNKIHDEIKADADLRSREIMVDLVTNLGKEATHAGLLRIGYCLDVMMKSVWFDRPAPDYNRYIAMLPILKTEILNSQYVVAMFLGLEYDANNFDKLIFKEG